jgi:hypothetical protein
MKRRTAWHEEPISKKIGGQLILAAEAGGWEVLMEIVRRRCRAGA